MRILVKETDKLYSVLHTDKVITEYIIYLVLGDQKLESYICYTEQDRNEYILDYLVNMGEYKGEKINEITKSPLVTYVSYREFIKNLNNE